MNYNIQIKRKKIKNIILKVKNDGSIHLSVPYGISKAYIDNFILRKSSWIEEQLIYIKNNYKEPINNEFVDGESFYYLGQLYILRVIKASYDEVRIVDGFIEIYTKEVDNKLKKEMILNDWYKEKAKILFGELVSKYEKILDKKVNIIKLRWMKTRWGSCNVKTGNINFNLELVKKPIICVEYVVLHELAHLEHPNHSKDFWNYVSLYMPNYKEIKKLL